MKSVLSILRQLSRYEREREARLLKELEGKKNDLKHAAQEKHQKFLSETKTLQSINHLGFDFQGFYTRFQTEQDLLEAQIHICNESIECHYDTLMSHFEQEKKYDKVDQERQRTQKDLQEKRAHHALDEWSQRTSSYAEESPIPQTDECYT